MNKIVRGLLSGASFAALNFGIFAGTARATGLDFHGTQPFVNFAGGHLDYIWVHTDGNITGDLTNHGTIGPPGANPPAGAIEINGQVGNFINESDGVIQASNWAIDVNSIGASVSGVIENDGQIQVTHSGAGHGGGFHVTADAHVGDIVNHGSMQLNGANGSGGYLQILNVVVTGNGGTVANHFSNTAGIDFTAKRTATGLNATAGAHVADTAAVIFQSAHNFASSSRAQVSLTNGGGMTIHALASVHAATTGRATASFGVAISQKAHGFEAAAQLTNSGTLDIRATAGAGHNSPDPAAIIDVANAFIAGGIKQIAQGSNSGTGSAAATLHNSHGLAGLIDIRAKAFAAATGVGSGSHVAHAEAHAEVHKGIYQRLVQAETVKANITNDAGATISILASAQADYNGHSSTDPRSAYADAHIRSAIVQSAVNASTAHLKLENHGAITVGILASAIASVQGKPIAFAFDQYSSQYDPRGLVFQSAANGASHVFETLHNDGAIKITEFANVHANTGNHLNGNTDVASAFADGGQGTVSSAGGGVVHTRQIAGLAGMVGFTQRAQVAGGSTHTAHLNITNDGTFDVKAEADAFGGNGANAHAHIATGIRQVALFGGTASAKLSNQSGGALDIAAVAYAGRKTGASFSGAIVTLSDHMGNFGGASAYVKHGILQNAGSANHAHLTLENAGDLTIRATGYAAGLTQGSAKAFIGVTKSTNGKIFGISQRATGATLAAEKIHNSGDLKILANAVAVAVSSSGREVNAYAQIDGIGQYAAVTGARLLLTNDNSIVIKAHARGSVTSNQGTHALVSAVVRAGISQSASRGGTASIQQIANALFSVTAAATARGGDSDGADAFVGHGIEQIIHGSGLAKVQNAGTLHIAVSARQNANFGGSGARANAVGIEQHVFGGSTGHAFVGNDASGVMSVQANAHASGGATNAVAQAGGTVIQQRIDLEDGRANVSNSGDISLHLHAGATGLRRASASAGRGGSTTAAVIAQRGTASSGLAIFSVQNNGGAISGTASAAASGAFATARARIRGVFQSAQMGASGNVVHDVFNDGQILVVAKAVGHAATGTGHNGIVAATATGVSQYVELSGSASGLAKLSVTNSGQLTVKATATGAGVYGRGISARAIGVVQSVSEISAHMHFDNAAGASMQVKAVANGAGAHAQAVGLGIVGSGESYTRQIVHRTTLGSTHHTSGGTLAPVVLSLDVHNEGSLKVTATGIGAGAQAAATGIAVFALSRTASSSFHTGTPHISGHHQSTHKSGAALAGNIENDGTLKVTAKAAAGTAMANGIALAVGDMEAGILNKGQITVLASGLKATAAGILIHNPTAFSTAHTSHGTGSGTSGAGFKSSTSHATIENDGTLKVTAKAASGAVAQGISLDAKSFTGTIVNKGTIAVEADGAGGQAVAIHLADSDNVTAGGSGSITNNGGTISAKLVNGGVTTWGTAINVSKAANVMNIGLSGNGTIYGNVKLKSNSAVTVSGPGVTFFSGVINPNKTKAGTLTIAAGGNLEMANDATQKNASAYVTTYNQAGTLSVDTGPTANTTAYINAGAATLSGPLVLVPSGAVPTGGTTYKILATDSALTTQFSAVSVKGSPALFAVTTNYLPNEADVVVGMTAAANVPGLTANQLAILTPFEKQIANILVSSSVDPNSAFGKLVAALFALTAPQLADVLDQLGDQDVGAQTQAGLDFASSLLSQILDHLGIGGGAGGTASLQSYPAGVRPAQMTSGAGTVWGGIYGAHASTASVAGTPGSGTTLSGFIAGYDMALNTDLLAGLAFAYSTDTTHTGSPGGHGSANGFQVSPYFQLARDSGFFARGSLSYGNYNNKLSRTVTVPGFGSGTLAGKFNSDVYSAYLEAGQKFDMDGTMVSPYAALGYARSASDSYTETGFAGPALHVDSALAQTLTSYLGVGFEQRFAMGDSALLPHVRIAWAHDYSGSAWQVAAEFAALPGSGFVINGPSLSRDKAYINAGISLHLSDDIETSLNYDALFNNDQSQQSLMGVLRFSF